MSARIWMQSLVVLALPVLAAEALAGSREDTEFLNQGGISFTRHNLTQRQPGGGGPNGALMDGVRNNYGEVCVYCHTPHGANRTTTAPLWNRTMLATSYTTYDTLNTSTLTQTVTTPGANSLTCLSCHDGTTAIDSVINMPGSGRYQASQETTQDNAFLDTWAPTDTFEHNTMNESTGSGSCLSCHSNPGSTAAAQDFDVFAIGTDLTNDHPVGITFPTSSPDFNVTDGTTPTGDTFFDANANGRMDPGDIRLYETGDGPEVECASCHDPHGVPSAGPGSTFNATFLRIDNAGSAVCLTCHIK